MPLIQIGDQHDDGTAISGLAVINRRSAREVRERFFRAFTGRSPLAIVVLGGLDHLVGLGIGLRGVLGARSDQCGDVGLGGHRVGVLLHVADVGRRRQRDTVVGVTEQRDRPWLRRACRYRLALSSSGAPSGAVSCPDSGAVEPGVVGSVDPPVVGVAPAEA